MTESVARLRGDQQTPRYGSYTDAKNLHASIPDRHLTAIIRPNGCGKSTLLPTLSRPMTPVDRRDRLDGEQQQRYASKEVARRT
ncbi:ATP-binding cassette domain-containing protein, partial [Salmonella enterica]|uniref:ATP-binding cassette domain-containing protein n=1 Tax=Salmonella enterica TaxID=28901 RepID=UPI00122D9B72